MCDKREIPNGLNDKKAITVPNAFPNILPSQTTNQSKGTCAHCGAQLAQCDGSDDLYCPEGCRI